MSSPVKPREWEKSLTVKCRLCGGAKCKRCSESAALAKTDSPVNGLHADWVAGGMLGMMRPSSRLMKEYSIAQQFHKLRIAAVFNLTLPGEHPYCGDGLGPSGFPYDPEKDLMVEQIRFFNFGWEDMTTPTLPFMLDIVKVMASVLQDGHNRLAVHCHAGYGRTGLAIACCLVFMHSVPPDRAIKIVRRDRPGSIQTSAQAKFVRQFHEYLHAARLVFALPKIHDRFTLTDFVDQQNRLVHGERSSVNGRLTLPCIVDFLCRELERTTADAAVLHAFVFHVTWQWSHSFDPVNAELQGKHNVAVCGEGHAILADRLVPTAAVGSSPPPVPASLHVHSTHVSQDELTPVKIAFNMGEFNWPEAMKMTVGSALAPALLLDWLEHLAEPLLSTELVTADDSDKWKQLLNQEPTTTVRTLDRVLCTLRGVLKRLPEPTPLADAVHVRLAMALFHLTPSTPVATLCRHAAFCRQLLSDWHAPKRLELNMDSLHKLSKTASLRKLQSPTGKGEALVATPPISPTRGEALETPLPVHHHTRPVHLPTAELSPLKQERETPPHASPTRPIERPPVELPPMAREKEDRDAEPSPVKMESLIPRLVTTSKEEPGVETEVPEAPAPASHKQEPVVGEVEKPRPATPPPLTRGSGSGGSVYTLPSVKGGDRYKNRQL